MLQNNTGQRILFHMDRETLFSFFKELRTGLTKPEIIAICDTLDRPGLTKTNKAWYATP